MSVNKEKSLLDGLERRPTRQQIFSYGNNPKRIGRKTNAVREKMMADNGQKKNQITAKTKKS